MPSGVLVMDRISEGQISISDPTLGQNTANTFGTSLEVGPVDWTTLVTMLNNWTMIGQIQSPAKWMVFA